MTKIAAIVAAAGASRRFGAQDKLLSDVNAKPLLAWTLEAIPSALLDRVIVVHPPDGREVAGLAQAAGFEPVANRNAQAGLGDSIARGISTVAGSDAAIVCLGDMPLAPRVTPALVATWRAERSKIVAPVRQGRRGHPVLFDKSCFADLTALSGDDGARAVVEAFSDELALVETDDDGVVLDVDVPADLARMAERLKR